jgi:hypothetical protein
MAGASVPSAQTLWDQGGHVSPTSVGRSRPPSQSSGLVSTPLLSPSLSGDDAPAVQCQGHPSPPLRRRVREAIGAWAAAGASGEVLRWIREGVRVPWNSKGPPPAFHHGPSLAGAPAVEQAFMRAELPRLLESGAIEKVGPDQEFVTKVFLVPKPGPVTGSFRMVMDLRYLNSFCVERTCRFETLKVLRRLAAPGDWMLSLDLQDGYHAVGIHPSDRKYFTFQVEGLGYFQYAALNFGWSLSPYVFVKMMRTVVGAMRAPVPPEFAPLSGNGQRAASRWAGRRLPVVRRGWSARQRTVRDLWPQHAGVMQHGLRVLPYMDDFLFLFGSQEEARAGAEFLRDLLEVFGLALNEKKSVMEPVQQLKHLGIGVDTARGRFYVTEDRLQRVRDMARGIICQSLRRARRIPARALAAFAGLTQSLHLAIPPARFFNRSIYDAIGTRRHWGATVALDRRVLRDLQWYVDLPARWRERAIWRSASTALLHTDASKKGWGAVLNQRRQARGFWRGHQQSEHINVQELRAVRYAVDSFLPQLRGRSVLLREDNQVVCALIERWTTRSGALMVQLEKLWWTLDSNDIEMRVRYIRSEDNAQADALSRVDPEDEWTVDRQVFIELERSWGPHQVDRFASVANAHLPRYNTAWDQEGSAGLDAFAQPVQDWQDCLNWCAPPVNLLLQLAQLLRETGAGATVVAPYWPAQHWFQALHSMAAEVRLLEPQSIRGTAGYTAPASWRFAAFRVPTHSERVGTAFSASPLWRPQWQKGLSTCS